MICFPSVGKRKLCPDAKGGVGLRGVTADVAETACTAHSAHPLLLQSALGTALNTTHPYQVTIVVNSKADSTKNSRLHQKLLAQYTQHTDYVYSYTAALYTEHHVTIVVNIMCSP